MLTLNCPYCGIDVDETDLIGCGAAHLKRMSVGTQDADFEDYLFNRDNPMGVHFERWRHVYGCGKWFLAARDTVTQEVFGTYSAQTLKPTQAIVKAIKKKRPNWQEPP